MSQLTRFTIYGLFNEYDVDLDLSQDVNIFVGENGMGKTTILNCLYSVLSGRLNDLNNIAFKKIEVTFNGDIDKQYSLSKLELMAYFDRPTTSRRMRGLFDHVFSRYDLQKLEQMARKGLISKASLEPYWLQISDMYDIPEDMAYFELRNYLERSIYGDYRINKETAIKNVHEFLKDINDIIKEEIIYFPTYRRIEEDMSKLGLDVDNERNRDIKGRLIKFGMSDVEVATSNILSTIRGAAIDGFNMMTGVLLKQYLNSDGLRNASSLIDIDILEIVLNRIGSQIDERDKETIRKMARTGELYDKANVYLLNLVMNLINSYKSQSKYDDKIRNFRDACNGFLEGKYYCYDESNLDLKIQKNSNGHAVELGDLSSGEKQIISVFSKLYLEESENCIILFDEPELSLSLKWQKHFLSDIMASKKCSKLIAVTHSPFIFDNELYRYASDMGICIKEV